MTNDLGQQLPATRNLHESLSRAEDLAARRKHTVVGLDHLLLAMGQDPDAVAVLLACKVNVEALCLDLLRKLGPEARALSPNAIPPSFDVTVQNLIAHASAAALASGQTEIDGANILSAIISGEGGMITHKILERHGLTFDEALKTLNQAQQEKTNAKPLNEPKVKSETKTSQEKPQQQPKETQPTPPQVKQETQVQSEQKADVRPIQKSQQEEAALKPDLYQDTIVQTQAHPSDYDLSPQGPIDRPTPPQQKSAPPLAEKGTFEGQPPQANPAGQKLIVTPANQKKVETPPQQQRKVFGKKDQKSPPLEQESPQTKAMVQSQAGLGQGQHFPGPPAGKAPPPPPDLAGGPMADNAGMTPMPPNGDPLEPKEVSLGKQTNTQNPQNALQTSKMPAGQPPIPTNMYGGPAPETDTPPMPGGQPLRQPGAYLPPDGRHMIPQGQHHGPEGAQPPIQPLYQEDQAPPFNPQGHEHQQPHADDLVVENIPKVMRVGKIHYIEVRVARFANAELDFGTDHYGLRAKDEKKPITKAITVRLTGPDGQFLIDGATASTQWSQIHKGVVDEADFAIWRWRVMPRKSGKSKLKLDITIRSSSEEGISAEIPVQPSRSYKVKVTRNYGAILKSLAIAGMIFGVGYGVAKYGQEIMTKAQTQFENLSKFED